MIKDEHRYTRHVNCESGITTIPKLHSSFTLHQDKVLWM